MKRLIFIKLGGSVVTNKSKAFVAREQEVKRFAREIKDAARGYDGKIILGHGAGSFAHIPASKYKTKAGLTTEKNSLIGAAKTEEAARQLNGIVVNNFISENLPVFPFSPASFLLSDTKIYIKSYIDSILEALKVGLIPLVYGDVVMDKKQGFTIYSTEKVFEVLALALKDFYKIRQIYVTDVDGVYDEKGKTIPKIFPKNFGFLKPKITGAKNVDVTGGMIHKVEEAIRLTRNFGIETLIVNGRKPGELRRAILGLKTLSTQVS